MKERTDKKIKVKVFIRDRHIDLSSFKVEYAQWLYESSHKVSVSSIYLITVEKNHIFLKKNNVLYINLPICMGK